MNPAIDQTGRKKPRATYRSSVTHNRQRIGYPVTESKKDSNFQQPIVDHSLVWRFVGWLGGLTLALRQARRMLLAHNPNSLSHRTSGSVDPQKCLTDQRQAQLETARELLLIIPEWEECFGCKFFPRFATRAGFD